MNAHTRIAIRCWVTAVLCAVLSTSCSYSPHPASGTQICGGPGATKNCPTGYYCASNNTCWRQGEGLGSLGATSSMARPFPVGADEGGTSGRGDPMAGTGGATGAGATTGVGGGDAAGSTATAGQSGTAGADGGTGGAKATGGKTATGGTPATGGTTGTGGSGGAGGAQSLGGSGGTPFGGAAGGSMNAFVFAAGDIGDCDQTADSATSLLLDGTTEPILALGDIGYEHGSADDFANCFDPDWGRHKSRIWPAPGNHDYETAGAIPYFDYFGAAAGESGKGYYSVDIGTWHVISLNSNCVEPGNDVRCDEGSAQEQWLRADLAAHPTLCTLAFWHHPRFSSGNNRNNEGLTPLWKALMDFGTDVVLVGHDHDYERFSPVDENGAAADNGIAEFIVGTGGSNLINYGGTQGPASVIRNRTAHGLLHMALRPDGYDWQFLPIVGDTFTDQGSASCH